VIMVYLVLTAPCALARLGMTPSLRVLLIIRPIQRPDDHESKKVDDRSELQVTAQQQIECKADSGYVVLSFRNKHTDRIPYHNWRPSCSKERAVMIICSR
jgi:hypothetical protein